jgi:hypothetical protein
MSKNEKENKLKPTEISGFSSIVTSEKLVCEKEELKNELSQCMVLSGTVGSIVGPESTIHYR